MTNYLFKESAESVSIILKGLYDKGFKETGKRPENTQVLYNYAGFTKFVIEKYLKLRKGTKYSATISVDDTPNGVFHFESRVGADGFYGFEFDAPTFNKLGFTNDEILATTLIMSENMAIE